MKIGFQRQFTPAQHHIVDLVVSQVAQRGGEAFLTREEVLVDTQHARAAPRMPFGKLALDAVLEVAIDGGRANAFALTQTAAVDPVPMLAVDHPAERFTGSLTRQDARKPLVKIAPATQAQPLAPF